MILTVLGYLFTTQNKPDKIFNNEEPSGNVMVLDDDSIRYAIPTKEVKESNPTDATISESKPLLSFKVDNNLYSFIGSETANITTGIRTAPATSRNFISRVLAADPYPVVYYVDYRSGANVIVEMNIFTGKTRDIVEEKILGPNAGQYVIGSLSFSSKNQKLLYSIKTDVNATGGKQTAKLFDLETGKAQKILEDQSYAESKWAPDGSLFSVAGIGKIYFYDANGVKKSDYQLPEGAKEYSYYWQDTSGAVCFDTPTFSQDSVRCVATNGESSNFGPLSHGYAMSGLTRIIKDKVYGFRIPTTSNDTAIWFFSATKDGKATDYKDKTQYLTTEGAGSGWLLSSSAEKSIFLRKREGNGSVEVFNISSNDIKNYELPSEIPTSNLRIIGWSGNQENILLWANNDIFWNVDITNGKVTKLTR